MSKIKGLELEHKTILDQYGAWGNPALISSQHIGDYYFHQLTPLGKYYYNNSSFNVVLKHSSMYYLAINFITTDPNVYSLENIERKYQPNDINLIYNHLTYLGYLKMELGKKKYTYQDMNGLEGYLFNSYDFLTSFASYPEFSKILSYSPYKIINDIDYVLINRADQFTIYIDVTKIYKPNIFKTNVSRCLRHNGHYYDYQYNWETDINDIIFPHGLKKEHLRSSTTTHLELTHNDYPPIHPINEVPEFKKSVWLNVNSYSFIKDNKIYIYFPKDWQSYPNQYGWRYIEVEYYEYIIPFGARCCLAECFGITE